MGHYAKINEENIVENVIVASLEYIHTLPDSASYIKTSYNTKDGVHYVPNTNFTEVSEDQSKSLRKNMAIPGGVYDSERDCFRVQQPFDDWILDENTCQWQPPIPCPGEDYFWDEEENVWVHDPAVNS